MKRLVTCLLFLLFLPPAFLLAQSDSTNSPGLRISILTCSPGDELYSLFGHSALRITDLENHTDIIYNWGTFEGFDEPDFYWKFMRGKLRYYVSPDNLNDFAQEYIYEGRSVTEQILNIPEEDKIKIKQAVDVNMQGDNRYYKYDFLFDNCTTRIRDLVEKNVAGLKQDGKLVAQGTTFRNMLYSYLDEGHQPWSKLGIDILLGAKLDKPVTNYQAMFLPEYLMKAMDMSERNGRKLVAAEGTLVEAQPRDNSGNNFAPLLFIALAVILFTVINLSKKRWAIRWTNIIDSFLLYTTGLIGILLVFMWFFTDHIVCSDNYNLLWAIPFNFFVAFFSWKKSSFLKRYFTVLAVITAILLLTWFILPQQFNLALLPFCGYMLFRYIKLSRR